MIQFIILQGFFSKRILKVQRQKLGFGKPELLQVLFVRLYEKYDKKVLCAMITSGGKRGVHSNVMVLYVHTIQAQMKGIFTLV